MKKALAIFLAGLCAACGGQGSAETKMQSSKPGRWVGCYEATGRGWETGTRTEKFEIRQEGGKLFMPLGKEGKYDQRFMMQEASQQDLDGLKAQFTGRPGVQAGDVEVASGLVVYEVDSGWKVTPVDRDKGMRLGFYWIRAKGEPETLYAVFPFAFDKTKKAPCPKG